MIAKSKNVNLLSLPFAPSTPFCPPPPPPLPSFPSTHHLPLSPLVVYILSQHLQKSALRNENIPKAPFVFVKYLFFKFHGRKLTGVVFTTSRTQIAHNTSKIKVADSGI